MVACALVEKGSVLDSIEEAIKVYDDVNRRFDKAPQAELREQGAVARRRNRRCTWLV